MRVHRIYYRKGKNGRPLYSKNWYVQMKDHVGVARYFVGFTDKRQTTLLGEQIQRLVNFKQVGEKPDGQMTRFVNGMSPKLRLRLAEIGLLDKSAVAAGKQLKDHVNDFYNGLIAKGDSTKQARQITSRVIRIVNGCHFEKYDDIRTELVITFLNKVRAEQRNMSARTSNFYVKAIKQFCSWMIRNDKASSSPVQYAEELDQSKVRADARHPRRGTE